MLLWEAGVVKLNTSSAPAFFQIRNKLILISDWLQIESVLPTRMFCHTVCKLVKHYSHAKYKGCKSSFGINLTSAFE